METTHFRARSFLRIPQELIDYIIDELEEDTVTLRACALTSRCFTRPSQRNLFHCIKIQPLPPSILDSKDGVVTITSVSESDAGRNNQPRQSLCERLYALLQSSPHISSLIRDLRLHDTELSSDSWLIRDTSLPLVLPLLANLQRIYVAGSMSETLLDFGRLPAAVKEALFTAMRSPKVTHIGFQCVQFPTFGELLDAIGMAGCGGLKSLTLFAVDIPPEFDDLSSDDDDARKAQAVKRAEEVSKNSSHENHQRSHLSSLALFMGPSLSSQLSDWILSPDSSYSLEALDKFSLVAEMTHELSLAKHVITASKKPLEEINITVVEGEEDYDDTLDLSVPQVVYFGLDISSSDPLSCQSVLDWWCKSLGSSENNSDNHNLKIFNIFILTELSDITSFQYSAPGWKRLDEILYRRNQGTEKQTQLNVRLKLLDDEDDDEKEDPVAPPEVLERLRDAFPLMKAKERLDVSQMTESLFSFLGVYWR
ncbi:hypothetical protein VKT23_010768 [Stygiomarasmius scandens]|uniref:F-box domain-containing protein n=1 Tax=Marasmiellus scandens TaxID=2682957 RepID=A0ABR1JAY6_9AGAR